MVICSNLRKRNPDAIVVQRLKRLESIMGKLERFPDMNLYRMQDLGGCRVILDTIEQVYDSVCNYKVLVSDIYKNVNMIILKALKHLGIVLIIWFISFKVTKKKLTIKIC